MKIDSAQQVLRLALLREMARRAITAKERAEWKEGERVNRESESTAPTVNETEPRSDAGKADPPAI